MVISGFCSLPDVGPISPGNVRNVSSNMVGSPAEVFQAGQRNILTRIRVVWLPPLTLGSGVTEYQVRVATQPVELNDMSFNAFNEANTVDAKGEFELEEPYTFFDVPVGTVFIYVQVKIIAI